MAQTNKRVTKTRGKLTGNIVNTNIEIRPIVRDTLDLGKWRNATKFAESTNPRRIQLYDMYTDLAGTDGHWAGVWAKRVDAITTADWLFTDANGEPVLEVNQLLDCIGFEDLLAELIATKGFGKTLLEPTFIINDNDMNELVPNLIPRKHYRCDLKLVTTEQTGDTGISYLEGIYAKTVMNVGKDDDLGIFLAAAGYAILKRGATGDWASFVEKFGQGIIDGEWDGYDDAQRVALSKALDGMGSGGVIIRPAGTKITAIMPTGNATGQLQMGFVDYCNKEISKALLGTTETVESSKTSGYAQSLAHQHEDEKKNDADINYVRRYLNSEFIKVLISAGFNVKGGTFILKSEKQIPKKDAFKIHKEMALELKVPFSDDFFYEEYEMPKPDDYDAQIAERAKAVEPTKVEAKAKPIAKPSPPLGAEGLDGVRLSDRSILKKLADFFRPARSLAPRANESDYLSFKDDLNAYYTACCNHHTKAPFGGSGDGLITLADMPKFFGNLIDELIRKIFDLQDTPYFDQSLFDIYADELTKAVLQGYGQNDVADFNTPDTGLIDALKQNVIKFSAAKTERQMQDMSAALIDRNNQVRSWADFKIVAQQIADTQLNWLKTEYETAIGSGQMASKWATIQAQKDLFPLLMFDAVIDDHSTELCSSLNGVIKPVDDPFWMVYFPLNHFNCRSTVQQLTDGVITPDEAIEYPVNMPEAFKKNLSALGKVFPDEHSYYDKPKTAIESARSKNP